MPKEHLTLSDLQALAAGVGVVAPPPLKALPWLMRVERRVYCFTPFLSDTRAGIRGKSPQELAGYDTTGADRSALRQLQRGLAAGGEPGPRPKLVTLPTIPLDKSGLCGMIQPTIE